MFYGLGILFVLLTCKQEEENKHSLRLVLEGAEHSKGSYYVALYRKTDSFPSEKKAYKQKIQAAANAEIVFENLPENTYAIAVYHDANNNGKMDKNLFGVPTEKYGFSNNARGTFSAPAFSEAAFKLGQNKVLKIKVE